MSLWIDTTVMELISSGFFLTLAVVSCYYVTPFKKKENTNDQTEPR